MTKSRRMNRLAPGLACVAGLLATAAQGNGINPPRPGGSQAVEAQCADRQTGEIRIVQRARITVDKPVGTLDVRLRMGKPQQLQLAQIERLAIKAGKPGTDGFGKATLALRQPAFNGEGFVQLSVDGKPVRLTGFSPAQERVDLPLQRCKELVLKPAAAAAASQPGAVKGS
jgi:hypothetical protein